MSQETCHRPWHDRATCPEDQPPGPAPPSPFASLSPPAAIRPLGGRSAGAPLTHSRSLAPGAAAQAKITRGLADLAGVLKPDPTP